LGDKFLLEVCIDAVDSAIAAQRGGADRVELCSNLPEGGVTPSAGLIAAVRQSISIDLHVMIRPRGGDFLYSEQELAAMERDIATAKNEGANAVVFGLLDCDGNVDVERTKRLVALASPLRTTFHRAFDMSADLFSSLRALQTTGVHRVLTSGGKQTAAEGIETIAQLVKTAGNAPAIIAGSGINTNNVRDLLEKTGAREIHASLRDPLPSSMRYRNRGVSMGAEQGLEYHRLVVQEEKVRNLLQAARQSEHTSSRDV
jgi:copper homeostasis protein